MQQFLLLIREDLKQRAGMTAERFEWNIQEMRAWIDAMAATGNYLDASALHNNRCPLVHNGTDAIVEVRPILPTPGR